MPKSTSCVQASTRLCTHASASCWLVRRRARMHRPHAGLFAGVHACICLMLTCSPACTPASASCWLVRRRARMHRPHAGLFAGVHACIGLMLTCSLACTHASALCRLVRRRAGVHRPHPDLFIDIHACIGLRAELHNGVHASIDLDRACRKVSSDCRGGGSPAVMQVADLTVLDRVETMRLPSGDKLDWSQARHPT